MFSKLPELCHVKFLNNEIQIISIKKYSCVSRDLVESINGKIFLIFI